MEGHSGGQVISSTIATVWNAQPTLQGTRLGGDLTLRQQEEASNGVNVLDVLRRRQLNPSAHRTPFPLSRFRDHTEELETDWGVCFPTAGTAEVKAGRMSWRGGGAWMWHEARACLARACLRACFCSSGT